METECSKQSSESLMYMATNIYITGYCVEKSMNEDLSISSYKLNDEGEGEKS